MKKHSCKTMLGWAFLMVFVLAFGYQERAFSFSCHFCRNVKTDKTVRFLWLPLRHTSRISQHYKIANGHTHDWFGYTNYEMMGYRGWVMMRLGCATRMYRDNKLPGRDFPEPKRST